MGLGARGGGHGGEMVRLLEQLVSVSQQLAGIVEIRAPAA